VANVVDGAVESKHYGAWVCGFVLRPCRPHLPRAIASCTILVSQYGLPKYINIINVFFLVLLEWPYKAVSIFLNCELILTKLNYLSDLAEPARATLDNLPLPDDVSELQIFHKLLCLKGFV
jgi:hypothetical protein